jgi:hypothetical protein
MLDLNGLIDPNSGWQLYAAYGINDSGQIVGTGTFAGFSRAYLLTPVPEPATIGALGLGVRCILAPTPENFAGVMIDLDG